MTRTPRHHAIQRIPQILQSKNTRRLLLIIIRRNQRCLPNVKILRSLTHSGQSSISRVYNLYRLLAVLSGLGCRVLRGKNGGLRQGVCCGGRIEDGWWESGSVETGVGRRRRRSAQGEEEEDCCCCCKHTLTGGISGCMLERDEGLLSGLV